MLDCFSAEEPELTLAALASRTAIPKSTVHRLAKVLVEQRLLKRTDAGFGLGIHLFEMGSSWLNGATCGTLPCRSWRNCSS